MDAERLARKRGAPKSSSKLTTKLGKSAKENPEISSSFSTIPYMTELGMLIDVTSCSYCPRGETSQPLAPYAMIRKLGHLLTGLSAADRLHVACMRSKTRSWH